MTAIDPTVADPQWLKYGAPLLSALLGSAVGGIVTWATAGKKLARERSFEKQHTWLVETHHALGTAIDQIAAAVYSFREEGEELERLVSAIDDACGPVEGLLRDALLFASRDALNRISLALRQFAEFRTRPFFEPERAAGHTLTSQTGSVRRVATERARQLALALEQAQRAIISTHRSLLGLKSLPKDAFSLADSLSDAQLVSAMRHWRTIKQYI